jgi:hypothetical protein
VRNSEPVTSPTLPSEATVPLTGATWTQNAEELNELNFIQTTVTVPSRTECKPIKGTGTIASLSAHIFLDGQEIAAFGPLAGETAGTVTRAVAVSLEQGHIFEPGKQTQHTITVGKVSDDCEGGTAHFTINSVAVDVVGIR